jgi:hypothetical protein
MVIVPSSKGCLNTSNTDFSNSKISSKKSTHLWDKLISQGLAFLHHPTILALEALYNFETSIASSIVKSGKIVAKALLNIVFQLPGGPSITILCPPEAAISSALFACSCQRTYLKSKLLFKSNSFLHNDEKSRVSLIFNSIFPLSISVTSSKLSSGITSIHGTMDASFEFAFGTNILLNHFSFAQIVAGKTDATFLSLQSSDNSKIKTESFKSLSSMNHQ